MFNWIKTFSDKREAQREQRARLERERSWERAFYSFLNNPGSNCLNALDSYILESIDSSTTTIAWAWAYRGLEIELPNGYRVLIGPIADQQEAFDIFRSHSYDNVTDDSTSQG